MDIDGLQLSDGSDMAHQNGNRDYNAVSGEVDVVSNIINGAMEKTSEPKGPDRYEENELLLNFDAVTVEDSDVPIQDSLAKEGEGVKDAHQSGKAQLANGPRSSKNEKLVNHKKPSGTQPLKSRDLKGVAPPTVYNGAPALNSRAKQPSKSSTFNEKQPQTIKQTGKSEAATSETVIKKTTLKPLNKAPVAKSEEDVQSASSPTESETRARKAGALPNYGFSFKCDERAEKRREFYTKLGEKIQAKEVEKNTMQAKSKESQEAELRKLRKSLNFKATPMPTFYQEPAPLKTELKKIPTTRPKSPKLGRRKSSSPADAEGIKCQTNGSGRLSLDANVSQNTSTTKDATPVIAKKLPRKSLPRLPSQKTNLTKNNQKTGAASKATEEENTTTSSKQQLSEINSPPPRAKVSEIEPEEEVELAAGEETQPSVEEAIAVEIS